MKHHRSPAKVAQALANPLRLSILCRLMEGPATVMELVAVTGHSQSKVSNHLAILRDRGLVEAKRRARQTTYELQGPPVAQLVETFLSVSGAAPQQTRRHSPIAFARTCYDHLAGRLGVALFDALIERGAIALQDPASDTYELGASAAEAFDCLGVNPVPGRGGRRRLAYGCLDWTARRPHLGGLLGARLYARLLEAGWVVKHAQGRAVSLSPAGRRALRRCLGLSVS